MLSQNKNRNAILKVFQCLLDPSISVFQFNIKITIKCALTEIDTNSWLIKILKITKGYFWVLPVSFTSVTSFGIGVEEDLLALISISFSAKSLASVQNLVLVVLNNIRFNSYYLFLKVTTENKENTPETKKTKKNISEFL